MSKKRASLQRKYVAFVAGMLAVNDRCEVGRKILSVDSSYRGCLGRADGLHHLRKRSAQGALIDPSNTRRCCSPCNLWVEMEPERAHKAGLVVREGDPDWDQLGARRHTP